jgi:hypothetical protein
MTQQHTIQEDKTKSTGNIDLLVHAAWNFAYTVLWNQNIFSLAEKEKAKRMIRQHLLSYQHAEKGYYSFCQRVLLAREYVSQNNQRFIPIPSVWLDHNNANGFAGTEAWMNKLLEKRSSIPLYKRNWKALAEAVLEMATDDTEQVFWYWKIYFLEREEGELWKLFLGIVANMQYRK